MQNTEAYLLSDDIIDWKHAAVLEQARTLSRGENNPEAIARICFEFVRDQIRHSYDYQLNPVTCRASDVLHHATGYCYAKSHLLAALLRANGIPAGLCYQRLSIDDEKPPFCLHGLNAVYLPESGWYRIDARGNREGIHAQFSPPIEKLAFDIKLAGEADLPEIWAKPLPQVVEVLMRYQSYQQVAGNLPDIEVIP